MVSLDQVISSFSPMIVSKIETIQQDGKIFLECLNSFVESELIDIVQSSLLHDYIRDIIMNATEDSPVQSPFITVMIRKSRQLLQLFSIV